MNEYDIEKITRLATEVATKTYYELAKQENAQLSFLLIARVQFL